MMIIYGLNRRVKVLYERGHILITGKSVVLFQSEFLPQDVYSTGRNNRIDR